MAKKTIKERVINHLNKTKLFATKNTLCSKLGINKNSIHKPLGELRKEQEVTIYMKKYWGIIWHKKKVLNQQN